MFSPGGDRDAKQDARAAVLERPTREEIGERAEAAERAPAKRLHLRSELGPSLGLFR